MNRMRGTHGMGQVSPDISGNVAKHSGEFPETFPRMSPIFWVMKKIIGQSLI